MANKKEGITSKILTYAAAGLLALAVPSIIKDCKNREYERSQREQQTQYSQRILEYDECPFQSSDDIKIAPKKDSLEELAQDGTIKQGDWFIFEQGEEQSILIKSSAIYRGQSEDGMYKIEMYQIDNSTPLVAGKTDQEARETRITKIKRQKK